MPETPPSLDGLSPAEKRILLAKLLQERAARGVSFPVTAGQRGLWVLQQRDPRGAAYNIAFPSRIRSQVNAAALARSLDALVRRHAALRTTFSDRGGELIQCVQGSMPEVLAVHDASSWSDSFLQARMEAEIERPIDLQHGPLLRAHLFTRHPDDHAFMAVTHHIVADFWSLIVLLDELGTLYPAYCAGREPQLPPAGRPFADFARWQAEMLAGPQGERLAEFWTKYLNGVPHALEFPASRPRPPVFNHRAAVIPCQLNEELTSRLVGFASQERVTLYAVLLAAYQVLLSRYTGQRDFVVGSPFVGRTRPGYEQTVGYFVNMLPLRANLAGAPTFRELLRRVAAEVLNALEHQDFPFPLIVERLRVARDPSRPPLVQATFTLEKSQRQQESGSGQFLFPDADARLNVGGLVSEPYFVEPKTCRHEVEWVLEQSHGVIRGLLSFSAEVLEAPLMRRMMDHLQYFLAEVVDNPDVPLPLVPWFPESERALVMTDWNRTRREFRSSGSLHGLFEHQARTTPNAAALKDGDQVYSYRELDVWADRGAARLQLSGVARGSLVACCLDRSARQVMTLLAVLKAGGVYVPLDPHSPPERLNKMLAQLRPSVVIASAELLAVCGDIPQIQRIDAQKWAEDTQADTDTPLRRVATQPDDLAYIIHTSGSTGQPKGVMVEHRAICNTILWRKQALPCDSRDRVLLIVPAFFDASLSVTFGALSQGAQLVLADPGEDRNPTWLIEHLVRDDVTVLPATPRLLQVLVQHPRWAQCRQLRQIQTGGESMPAELPERIFEELDVELVNLYGPTETAVEAAYWKCRPDAAWETIPIGRPIANVQTYVLDDQQRPLPVGVAGELYIGGAGLARGYWNDPDMTSQRFVPHPFDEDDRSRLYRTGDRCRWLEDGNLQFLGRFDQQVKLRGYRIELEEVERALADAAAVAEAAVTVHANDAGEPQLVAYVVPSDEAADLSEDVLRRALRRQLPGYMIPTRIERVDCVPRTPSGKLDRRALPAPSWSRPERTAYVAPRTPLEQYLVEACQRILQVERIGVRDSFYELGGTSIQGAMLMAALQEELGERVEAVALFDLSEIAELADYLVKSHPHAVAQRFGHASLAADGEADASPTDGVDAVSRLLVPLQVAGARPPLFLVHPPGGIVVCYQPLARCLGTDQPLYGIRARGLQGEEQLPGSVEEMAGQYVAAVRGVQPRGPYHLGGWSLGGLFALEMARQLRESGEAIGLLAFFDTTIPHGPANQQYADETSETGLEYGLDVTLEQLGELGPDRQLPYLWEHARKLGLVEPGAPEGLVRQVLDDLKRLFHAHLSLASRYQVRPYPGRIDLFRPAEAPVTLSAREDRGWGRVADQVAVHTVPGQHHSMVKDPHVVVLARKLEACLHGQ